MDVKINAIALRSVDYQENDKLCWLYSAEYGRISVTAKSVKKAAAKMKYAVEPFCFGEYLLNQTHDRYFLTGCAQIESFYDLRLDLDKFYCGTVMLDAVASLEVEKQPNPQVFLLLLKALRQLLTDVNPKVLLVKFLLDYLSISGYKLDFDECSVCHSNNFDKMFLDFNMNGFVCPVCRTADSFLVAPPVLSTFKMIDNLPNERLSVVKVKDEYIKQALSLLEGYIGATMAKLKSLKQLLEL